VRASGVQALSKRKLPARKALMFGARPAVEPPTARRFICSESSPRITTLRSARNGRGAPGAVAAA
jgi:hypothetical protein